MTNNIPDLKKGRKWALTWNEYVEQQEAGPFWRQYVPPDKEIGWAVEVEFTRPGKLDHVNIEDIAVGDRLRALDENAVARLAVSIAEDGLYSPITVWTPGGDTSGEDEIRLVAGRHRLEACRRLGLETIFAFVISGDELDCQLREIDENLARAELTKLERADHVTRREAIMRERASLQIVQKSPKPAHRPGKGTDKTVKDTAAVTGRSERSVYQDLTRGRNIAPDVKQAIRGTPFADKGAELDALASMKPDDQRQAVEMVQDKSRKDIATFRDAKQFTDGGEPDEKEAQERQRRARVFNALTEIFRAFNLFTDTNVSVDEFLGWLDDDKTRKEFLGYFPAGEADVIKKAEAFDTGVNALRVLLSRLRDTDGSRP